MKQAIIFGAAFVACTMFTACSSHRLDELERRTRTDITDIRSIQADQNASLNTLRSEVRDLAGKIEELQYTSTGKTKELERTIQRLGSRVPPPAGVPEDLLSRDEERIATLTGPAADLYRKGLQQLRDGDIENSRASFQRFVEENPGTAFTDNALFWLGICYTKLGQYDRAVVSFSQVFQSYPAEDMVPPALYYLAQTFLTNGSTEDAILSLQKLVDEHPRSSYAIKGQSQLRELKAETAKKKAPAPAKRTR